ncbi:MAG: septal ring lytic transglycosylase RlpA family protein [Geminicoccaceae bacterium]
MRPGNRRFGRWLVVLGGLLLASCGSTPPEGVSPGAGHYKLGNPYQIDGRWYYPRYDPSYAAVGVASWYGHPFHGRKTANGEVFDRDRQSAAHPTLPLPSIVRVTNLANQRQLELRVNDRGPFVGERIIDLSQAAARALGFEQRGTTEVRVEFVRLADAGGVPPQPTSPPLIRAAAAPETTVALQPASEPAPQPVRVATPAVRTAALRVVPPADVTPPESHAAGDAPGKRCLGFIQVGAFVEPERAVRLAKDLDAALALPVSADLASVDRYARVRLGPIGDPGQAEAALRWLHQIGHANAFLVRPDVTSSVAC